MPYKDKEKQKEYQRNYISIRKKKFFNTQICAKCESRDTLEIHHLDPTNKIEHRIWSWSEERRLKELEKCEILCHECHMIKTKEQMTLVGPQGTSWCSDCKDFVNEKLFGPGSRFNGLREICNPCRKNRGWENPTSRKLKIWCE